jgi:hypothetical protein
VRFGEPETIAGFTQHEDNKVKGRPLQIAVAGLF